MTQKKAAERLGIAEATLSRWLNETQIQSRAMDNLLRVFFAFPQVRSALSGEGQDPQLGATDVSRQRRGHLSNRRANTPPADIATWGSSSRKWTISLRMSMMHTDKSR